MGQTMTGGEAMIRASIANGIDTVFGIPGAQIYPMYDAMARLGLNVITTRHEQGAAYMALGYAKATGRPGAFAVVPGPGVLNTTAALCTAMGTCSPVLCLTGQVPSQFLGSGRGHLHELPDQSGTLRSIIKEALHIEDPRNTADVMNRAFRTMRGGRPGPVSVEMCWDTMAEEFEDLLIGAGAGEVAFLPVDEAEIEAAAQLLSQAKCPLIMCGQGAQHASAEVLSLAEKLGAPVTAFRSGRGIVSEDHPLGVSSVAARLLFKEVDVVVGIGSRLEMIYMRWRDMNTYEKRPGGGPKLIRIDIDPEEMTRFEPDIGIVADAAVACTALASAVEGSSGDNLELVAKAKADARQMISKIQPQMAYLDVIREVLPKDGLFVPELSQMGFTSYYGFPVYAPRTYVTEGYQGTLGFGFQTALGVKVACPDKAVVCVTGDGGFMFGVQELSTAVAHNIGVVTLIFNNASFANVRRDQMRAYEGRLVGADLHNPDFVQLAESFGAAGYRVDSPSALKPVLEKALADDQPVVIDVTTPRGSETSPWEFIMMGSEPELTHTPE